METIRTAIVKARKQHTCDYCGCEMPKGYKLTGSRTDQVKQIGNSIPVQTAKAIVKAIFSKEKQ